MKELHLFDRRCRTQTICSSTKNRLCSDEFRAVRTFVQEMYETKTTVLDSLAILVSENRSLKPTTKTIQKSLKAANSQKWEYVSRRFYMDIVRSVMPDGTFNVGGDRRSATFRNAKQQALVTFVENKAKEAPETADEETVVADCIHAVDQRWSTTAISDSRSLLASNRNCKRCCCPASHRADRCPASAVWRDRRDNRRAV